MTHGNVSSDRFLASALASFHTSLLVLAFVLVFHLSGSLAFGDDSQGAGTVIGLAAFAALWLAAFVGVRRALSATPPRHITTNVVADFMGNGAVGGAIAGVVFLGLFAIATTAMVIYTTIDEGHANHLGGSLVFLVLFALIGGIVAAVIGAAVGIVAGLLDSLLLGWANLIAGQTPSAHSDAETPVN